MSDITTIEPVGGWELEIGRAEADGTPFASVREARSQSGQIFYGDKDPLIVAFLQRLASSEAEAGSGHVAAVTRERRRCADMLKMTNASLMLMAGEMTAQELRTTQAVLGGLQRLMLRSPARETTEASGSEEGVPHWLVRWR